MHAFFYEVLKEHTQYVYFYNLVAIAMGFHLFPYRTQQLSPYTPKVLAWKRAGRIGSCRLSENALMKMSAFLFISIIFEARLVRMPQMLGVTST